MARIMKKAESNPQKVISVLVPLPSERPYSYVVPEGMTVKVGSIVRVPLGAREVAGLVTNEASDDVPTNKLRADRKSVV